MEKVLWIRIDVIEIAKIDIVTIMQFSKQVRLMVLKTFTNKCAELLHSVKNFECSYTDGQCLLIFVNIFNRSGTITQNQEYSYDYTFHKVAFTNSSILSSFISRLLFLSLTKYKSSSLVPTSWPMSDNLKY